MHDGVININKPKGCTSYDVVHRIKKIINKKVGHTGTLDPMATGVLPICIGKASKISQYIVAQTKRYMAAMILGVRTDTLDITGKVLSETNFFYNETKILNTLKKFCGEYYQLPPMFSAIKKNGQKLYELARQGITIEREKRLINIYELNFVNYIPPNKILINVKCSKGTYIRSLCNDIGNEIGCGACLSELTRTECGNFFIENSITVDEFDKLYQNNLVDSKIIAIENLLDFKKVTVAAQNILYNGNKIDLKFVLSEKNFVDGEKLLVFDPQKKLIGIYLYEKNFLRPVRMLL